MRALVPGMSNGGSVGRQSLTLALAFAASNAALVLVLDDAAAPSGLSAMSASAPGVAPSPAAWSAAAQAASAFSALPSSSLSSFASLSSGSSVQATQTEPTASFEKES